LDSILKKDSKLLSYTRYHLGEITDIDAEDVLHEVAFNVFSKIDFESTVENVEVFPSGTITRNLKNLITVKIN
jgi:hypothetical protein